MTTQPAPERHVGTLDLSGEGNAPASEVSDETVQLGALGIGHVLDWTRTARDCLEAAYPAIREQVAEEIAVALEAVPAEVYPDDIFPVDGTSVDCQSARVMRFAYPAAARMARDIGGLVANNSAPGQAVGADLTAGANADPSDPPEPQALSKRLPGVEG